MTSKIKFKDVIKAINDYAFRASKYPVCISLENHCNTEQQAKMAEAMIHTFGDKLIREPVDEHEITHPSPSALVERIIVKGKKLKDSAGNGMDGTGNGDESGEVSDEDESADAVEFQFGSEMQTSLESDPENKETNGRKRKKHVSLSLKSSSFWRLSDTLKCNFTIKSATKFKVIENNRHHYIISNISYEPTPTKSFPFT